MKIQNTLSVTEGMPHDGEVLRRFASAVGDYGFDSHVARLRPSRTAAAPLAFPNTGDETWILSSYAGEVVLDGTRLVIEPQMGWEALSGWVGAATGLSSTASSIAQVHASHVPPLVSLVWVRAVDSASRHGPPAFRRDMRHEGANVRGHLDVRATVRLRAKGASGAASVYRARDLDNPVTRIIVAADRVLVRNVGHAQWHSDRVKAVLPQLYTAVGRRTHPPGDGELHRMRYTPITRPFKWAAELSARVVRHDPIATTPKAGALQGLVLDLASLWTDAVVTWTRGARPDLQVELTESEEVLLRDRGGVRAVFATTPGAERSGAPQLNVSTPGRSPSPVTLPRAAGEAARVVADAARAV